MSETEMPEDVRHFLFLGPQKVAQGSVQNHVYLLYVQTLCLYRDAHVETLFSPSSEMQKCIYLVSKP